VKRDDRTLIRWLWVGAATLVLWWTASLVSGAYTAWELFGILDTETPASRELIVLHAMTSGTTPQFAAALGACVVASVLEVRRLARLTGTPPATRWRSARRRRG
jgi:hypothetical protein